jgi:muramoyltetrapeptide carboxypeptidase
MEAILPPALVPGDCIAIISTARRADPNNIAAARKLFERWGYRSLPGRNLFQVENQFAGSDQERLKDLNEAIHNSEVKAIVCARGGYGSARIVDQMDTRALRKTPKWLVGYSDVTALHLHAWKHAGVASLHATMPLNFGDNTGEALASLRNQLEGKPDPVEAMQHRLNMPGEAHAPMIGGNLSVLYSMMGSPTQPDTRGCILFLEDVDEYLYHIDRMMVSLKRAGLLQHLAGMVVGAFTDMHDNQIPFGLTAEEIISHHTKPYGYPVCFNFPAGHIADNRAWVHGKKVRLTVYHDQPSSLNHS